MKIKVKVVPNSKIESIQALENLSYKIKVKEKAIDGNANIATINALANYLKIKKTNIRIIKGFANREKIIEIFE